MPVALYKAWYRKENQGKRTEKYILPIAIQDLQNHNAYYKGSQNNVYDKYTLVLLNLLFKRDMLELIRRLCFGICKHTYLLYRFSKLLE